MRHEDGIKIQFFELVTDNDRYRGIGEKTDFAFPEDRINECESS